MLCQGIQRPYPSSPLGGQPSIPYGIGQAHTPTSSFATGICHSEGAGALPGSSYGAAHILHPRVRHMLRGTPNATSYSVPQVRSYPRNPRARVTSALLCPSEGHVQTSLPEGYLRSNTSLCHRPVLVSIKVYPGEVDPRAVAGAPRSGLGRISRRQASGSGRDLDGPDLKGPRV